MKKKTKIPTVLSEAAIKPKKQKSPGKQKKPPSVDSILRRREY
jgi:hypothetical protein